MIMRYRLVSVVVWMLLPLFLSAATYYVDDRPINGTGTLNDPFNNFDDALAAAQPGDTVAVLPGVYALNSAISTVRDGTATQRITIKAYDPNDRPVITRIGRVLGLGHRYITVDGLIFNAEFADADVVRIYSGADHAILRNCEIKNSLRDGIDITGADSVLIENCEIHHLLAGSYTNQQDAHGIVASHQRHLVIRGCNIYYFSGDAFQTDPSRSAPLWDDVLIENCHLWTGPLPNDVAGWHQGEVPGENAVDTKIDPDSVSTGYRPRIVIRNVEAHGFVPGFISTRAPFNIKEQVECIIENVKVYQNQVAFRLRGPGSRGGAHVTIINAIAYDNDIVFRTEDDIELLHIYNGTFDRPAGGQYFQNVAGGYVQSGFELLNSLFMGSKPSDATDPSNLAADTSFFVNAADHDYHLRAGSPAIDAGVDIAAVTTDFEGNPRPAGHYDVGAFEYQQPTGTEPSDPAVGSFFLYPNFPNPFNPVTNVEFRIGNPSQGRDGSEWVTLKIYDSFGREVKTLVNGRLRGGRYTVQWDGTDAMGRPAASG
ncbi:MAG: hypothetical protein D6681_06230, partial [Calditrichaeota bacterium]